MTQTNSIIIDGQAYDAVTGLPIRETSAPATPKHTTPEPHIVHHPATKLHAAPQRSITLNRKAAKKPVPQKITIHKHQDIIRRSVAPTHNEVHKFVQHPTGSVRPNKVMDIGPVPHPHVEKAHAISAAKAEPLTQHLQSAKDIKNEAVQRAVQATPTSHEHRKPLRQRMQPRQRIITVVSAVFALVLLGGYFTYLNMPSLSVRVAAAQAGINANYPNYHPDGYALNGPVTFSDGKVSMNFKANGGDQEFSINQSKSGWNNEAVLDNYVTPKAGSNYIPYTERGLTIYTYDNSAAWVNGGILYTLEGNAPLSSEQIRRIATSLL